MPITPTSLLALIATCAARAFLPTLAALALVASSAAATACAAPAAAALTDPRLDADSGRALVTYAPGIPWDHQHMILELRIADMRAPKLDGVATITSTCRLTAAAVIAFDARETIAVTSVTVNQRPATFNHQNNRLTINLPDAPAPHNATITTRIVYTAENPQGNGVGLVWLTGARRGTDADDAPARNPQIFSQGQANWNSFWFPCHDFPNDRLSTELIVDAPEGFDVISNGKLLSQQTLTSTATTKPLVRWHWKQDLPHPAYLVMLAVGKFAKADLALPPPPSDAGASILATLAASGTTIAPAKPTSFITALPMRVYGPLGTEKTLATNFARTGAMVRFFEALFDEPYPWDKYDQIIVRGFRWGGMENTSATILAEYAATGALGDHDDLIVHEIAHQWIGNLITCASWEHLWLNEGWATFAEWLWVEHTQGRKAYNKAVTDAMRKLTILPLEPLPAGVPMVSKLYTEPDDTFEKAEDPYVRGGLVLHAIRRRLGDEAFFRGARLFIDRHRLTSVETDQFRIALEDASGEPLERLIDELAKRPAFPKLTVKLRRDNAKGEVEVTITQPQTINPSNPAYDLLVPVRITAANTNTITTFTIRTDRREATEILTFPGTIAKIEVDPDHAILGQIEIDD